MLKNINKKYILALLILWIIPTILYLPSILIGTIPFWYDPARDMISGLSNLHKVTLIGQPSGIPGIFYGPYWIWFLSIAEIFSKNPRWVVFMVQFFPYIFIGPIVFLGFRKIFGIWNCILFWLLFIFSYSTYTFYLWNPQLAPLFFLTSIYLLTFKNSSKTVFVVGFIEGLALNIHLSFSTGFVFGTVLFFALNNLLIERSSIKKSVLKIIKSIFLLVFGILITFIPFFVFEARHNFFQTKTAIYALSKGGAVVGVLGLSKYEVFQEFIKTLGILIKTPNSLNFIFLLIMLLGTVYLVLRRNLDHLSIKLFLLLFSILFSVFTLYMTAKNPIWEYHFIGLEIIYVLILGIVVSRFRFLKYALTIWVMVIFAIQLNGFKNGFLTSPYNVSSLVTKEHVVNIIAKDADKTPYTVLGYNSSIYIYDYSYLFSWMENKNFSYDPGKVELNTNIVYLIFPGGTGKLDVQNFINFRTPSNKFKTVKLWVISDGELVIKRIKIKSI